MKTRKRYIFHWLDGTIDHMFAESVYEALMHLADEYGRTIHDLDWYDEEEI